MERKKHLLSLILCIVMLISQISIVVYATDGLNSAAEIPAASDEIGQTGSSSVDEEKGENSKEKSDLLVDTDVPEDSTGNTDDGTDVPKDNTGNTDDGTDVPKDNTGNTDDGTDTPKDNTGNTDDGTDVPKDNTGNTDDGTDVPKDNTGNTDESTDVPKDNTGNTDDDTDAPKDNTGNIDESTDVPKENINIEEKAEEGLLDAIEEIIPIPFMMNTGPVKLSDYDVNVQYEAGTTYTIETNAELSYFSKLVNGEVKDKEGKMVTVDFDGATVTLIDNITLVEPWIPIGTSTTPFRGVFDGDKHTIKNLNIDASDGYQGLFGYTINGEVKNVTIKGAITNTAGYIGGIVAYANGTDISACSNHVTIHGGEHYVGGIAGYATGIISECANYANISTDKNYAGGIIGLNYGVTKDCFNGGIVSGENFIGGIVGKGRAQNCFSKVSHSGTGSSVGNISGDGALTNCYSTEVNAGNGTGNGTLSTEKQLKYSYVVYQLNTNGGKAKSGDLWKQGEEAPELGYGPVYKVNVINHAIDNVSMTIAKDNEDFQQGIFADGAKNTVYVGTCDLNLKVAEKEAKGGFHFNPVVSDQGGIYTFKITEDITIEGGYGELPSEILEGQMNWYMADINAASYTIKNEQELCGLAKLVNGTAEDTAGLKIPAVNFAGKMITLSQDLDLTKIKEGWIPIGQGYSNPFKGIFDGAGYKVTNIIINNADSMNEGLFGYIDSSEIKNLTVEGNIANTAKYQDTGGIVGHANNSNISNCINKAKVSGASGTGGIVGNARDSNISNCYNLGDISTTGKYSGAGGIVGSFYNGKVENCFSNSTVVSAGSDAGDIAGEGSTIYCYSLGKAKGESGGNGIVATEAQLKHNYVVYQLNTSGGTAESSNLWKQGAETPEPGFSTVYKVSILNYSSDKVQLSYKKDGDALAKEVIFSGNGIDAIYMNKGTLQLTTQPLNKEFVFKSGVTGQDGVYTVPVESDLTLKCGLKDELEAATGALACISWYTKDTQAASYTINTAEDLWGLMSLVNGAIQGYQAVDFSGKIVDLGTDIDLSTLAEAPSSIYNWTPIGSETKPFKGIFNGNNHTINGLHINNHLDYQGLFGYTSGGTIKNLKVVGTVTGKNYVGGILGHAQDTKISECALIGTSQVTGDSYVGGVVGNSTGTVEKTYSLGTVTGSGEHIGGVAGATKKINECFFYCEDTKLGVAGSAKRKPKACYYLANEAMEGVVGIHKTAQEFAGRELAYLLDTASVSHSKTWQTGTTYPVLGENTVYKISLSPKEVQEGKSVSIAQSEGEGGYPVYKNENGNQYAYVLSNEVVKLSVVNDEEKFAPCFYPQYIEVKENNNTYTVSGLKEDLELLYKFSIAVDENIAWYLGNQDKKEYTIHDESDLRGLEMLVNGFACDAEGKAIAAVDFTNKTIKLDGSIDVLGPDWTPIGGKDTPFNGTFDGGGYTVNNFVVASSEDYQGLFGYTGAATIKNLTVNGKVSGGKYVGGLVGYMGENSIVSNCSNAGMVIGSGKEIGGIAGRLDKHCKISDCSNSGAITGGNGSENRVFVGGIAGILLDNAIAKNCSNEGTITGNGEYTGGVFGNPYGNAVMNGCSNTGKVTANKGYLGGIAGGIDNYPIEMTDCWNSGEIIQTGNGSYKVGGITGDLGKATEGVSKVVNCYNTGIVTNKSTDTSDGSATGGLFGSMGQNYGSNVNHCWNTGEIISTASNTGGITGYISAGTTLIDCYNLGAVIGAAKTGGIAGSKEDNMSSNVVSCFNYGQTVTGTDVNLGAVVGYHSDNIIACYYLDSIAMKNDNESAEPADKKALAITVEQFKSYEVSYALNSKGGTDKNRGVWAVGEKYPVYATGSETLLHKAMISLDKEAKGSITFLDGSTAAKFFKDGDVVSFTVTPNDGYIMKKYDVKDISGKFVESEFSEAENGVCTVTFTMSGNGVIISADFVLPVEGSFKVTLDANGGNWTDEVTGEAIGKATKVLEVKANTRIAKPEAPTWNVRELNGWFTDKECKNPYNFSTAVQADFTLYAGWTVYYKVSFDVNEGKWDDEANSFAKVAYGVNAKSPEAVPVRVGYEFVGWYVDQEGLTPYDFKTLIKEDVTVYACWTREGTFQVIFDANGGSITLKNKTVTRFKVSVLKQRELQSPADLGYKVSRKTEEKADTLRGWYNNPKTGSKWKFSNPVEANMILYAHWDGDEPIVIGGTEEAPMELEDLDLLMAFRDCVNEGNPFKEYYFKLVTDLTLPKGWEPIGVQGSKFAAHFDGNGYTITVQPGEKPLFGVVDQAEIKNLNIFGKEIDGSGMLNSFENSVLLDGCTIKSGTKTKGSGFVGDLPLGGGQAVTIQNCTVESGVTVGYTKDQDFIGGLAGNVNCYIKNCVSGADVYGANFVGGIVGKKGQTMAPFEVQECYSAGSVTGTGNYIGGIVGGGYIPSPSASPAVQINDCYSTARISGGNYVGGIFGADVITAPQGKGYPILQNCYWHGDSIRAEGTYVGGIVGYYATVNDACILKNNYYLDPNAPEGELAGSTLKGIGGIDNIRAIEFDPKEAFKLKSATSFADGEVAYLLDGGEGNHRNVWTQRRGAPMFGTPSIYRVHGKTEGEGMLLLSGNGKEGIDIYACEGTAITVKAEPDQSENGASLDKKYKNILTSLTVTHGDGTVEDIMSSLAFQSAGNDVVTATFKLMEEPVEPEPKPEPKPEPRPEHKPDKDKKPGKGDGGSGNGSGSSIGDGTGNGSGTQGTEEGLGNGTGTAAGNTTGGSSTGINQPTANLEDVFTKISNENVPSADLVVSEDAKAEENEDIENAGGLEAGGAKVGNDEEEKDEASITVFEIIKTVAKENPAILVLAGILICVISVLGALNRYRKNKKFK